MVPTTAPTPPPGRTGVTFAEIAAHYGKAPRYVAENPRWGRHPKWPTAVGKRGRSMEFAPTAVADFVRTHHTRATPDLVADRLYTVAEIAAATGLEPSTIHADISRKRWPEADEATGDARMWLGATVTEHLATRRTYRRRA